jgi:hypothetical protein
MVTVVMRYSYDVIKAERDSVRSVNVKAIWQAAKHAVPVTTAVGGNKSFSCAPVYFIRDSPYKRDRVA